MEIKVQQVQAFTQAPQETQVKQSENPFQFILESKVDDEGLAARLSSMYESITMEGKHLAQKKDIREMQRYRILIKDFLNEILTRSHSFRRENYLDKKGRHRVYGIIRLIDENLDELAKELIAEEKDNIAIMGRIGTIEGLLLDIFT